MNEFYVHIETQVLKDGAKVATPLIFDSEAQAESKHHAVCSVAAVSDLPYHSSHVIRSDGVTIMGKAYDRRASMVESEEE